MDVATGNYIKSVTDLSLPDRGEPLTIDRTYNSLAAGVDGSFGSGWSSLLDVGVAVNNSVSPAIATVTQENGSTVAFTANGSGGWDAPSHAFATLVQNGDGSWTMVRRDRETLTFDSSGRLTSVADLTGDELTLTRDPGTGQVGTIADSAGHQVTVTWTGSNVTALTGTAGSPRWTITYGYDGAGNLASVTDQAGHQTTLGYTDPNGAHLLSTITDPLSHVTTTNLYDANSRVKQQTDATGGITTYVYNAGNTSVTDPTGIVTDYVVGDGLVASRTIGVGTPTPTTTSWSYDPATFGLASVTDPNGHVTSATYDPATGNQLTSSDAYQRTSVATYGPHGEQKTFQDATGVLTTRDFNDNNGTLLSVSTPLVGSNPAVSAVTAYSYNDPNHPGDVTSMKDPTNLVTAYTYNTAGQVKSVTDPSGGVTTFGYDSAGRQTWSVGPAGNAQGANAAGFRSAVMMDQTGQPVEQAGPGTGAVADSFARPDGGIGNADTGETWQTLGGGTWSVAGGAATLSVPAPDRSSLVVVPAATNAVATALMEPNETAGEGVAFRVQDANNFWGVFANPTDSNWLIAKVVNGQVILVGSTATGSCCTTGGAVEAVSSGSEVQVLVADQIEFQTNDSDLAGAGQAGLIGPDVGTTRFDGFITAALAPGATITGTFYDADERPITQIGAEGGVTHTVFDNADRPTMVTDPNNNVTKTTYDADGRVHIQEDGNQNQTTYLYNAQGRLQSLQQPGKPAPTTYNYTYQSAGEVDTVTLPDGSTAATTLDANDRPSAVAYTGQAPVAPSVTIGYDADGRRTTMKTGTASSSWGYNSLGQLTSSNRDGAGVTYGWDLAGRLTSIKYPGASAAATLGYNAGGQWNSITDWSSPNKYTTSFGYGPDEKPNSVTYPNGITAQITNNPAGAPTMMSYTAGGTTLASWSVARNPDQTITQMNATGVGDSYNYGYDPAGQLTGAADTTNPTNSSTYGYDPADQLTTNSATTQAFDTSGELCWSAPSPATGSCASPPAGATSYQYDNDGRRTTTTAPSGTSTYGWNTANQLASTATPAAGTLTYTYDGDGLLTAATSGGTTTPLAWDESGAVPKLLQSGTTSYLYGPSGIPIEQTSPTGGTQWLLTDPTGSVRAVTDPTGAVVGTASYTPWGATQATTGTVSVLGFDGVAANLATGLIYLQARWYDPATGQFLSPDPAGELTRQPYQYANNDPLNESDPAGLGQGILGGLIDDFKCGLQTVGHWISNNSGTLSGVAIVLGTVGFVITTGGFGLLADSALFTLLAEGGVGSIIEGSALVASLVPTVADCRRTGFNNAGCFLEIAGFVMGALGFGLGDVGLAGAINKADPELAKAVKILASGAFGSWALVFGGGAIYSSTS